MLSPLALLSAPSVLMPLLVAGLFIALTSLLREPTRQQFSALMIAGAGATYFGSSFRVWEVLFCALFLWLAFLGLQSYRVIALAWLLHTAWDLLHHLYGQPILPFVPLSSQGCAICDAGIALWYFLRAPSPWPRGQQTSSAAPLHDLNP